MYANNAHLLKYEIKPFQIIVEFGELKNTARMDDHGDYSKTSMFTIYISYRGTTFIHLFLIAIQWPTGSGKKEYWQTAMIIKRKTNSTPVSTSWLINGWWSRSRSWLPYTGGGRVRFDSSHMLYFLVAWFPITIWPVHHATRVPANKVRGRQLQRSK